jgi:hypothetical protein
MVPLLEALVLYTYAVHSADTCVGRSSTRQAQLVGLQSIVKEERDLTDNCGAV